MADTVFDDRAAGYDAVAESALGTELRARVHAVLVELLGPETSVADLGCGSGIDAEWLAARVVSVAAFDSSAEMIRLARQRCAEHPNVTFTQADVAAIELGTPVDLVVANFGVVNCVGDLTRFGGRLHDMLTPGGSAVIVTMPRWCPMELAVGVSTLNKRLVQRRRAGAPNSPAYGGLDVRYASATRLAEAFSPTLTLTHAESLGLVLPPFEQRDLLQNRPRPLGLLADLDRRLGPLGARIGWGDHHLCVFERSLGAAPYPLRPL